MELACPATEPRRTRPPTATAPAVPGYDRFAHFEVCRGEHGALDCLGQGGMGSTFRAFDTQLQREVALKVIHPERLHDPEARARFLREARAAARLQHPNIASILYQGEENGACFYAMELVAGEDLYHYIERVGPISPVAALRIAHAIALALDAAFQRDILHRDLKPANVMLTSYHGNGALHVKVIDFGLAKVITGHASTMMTQGFLGTPEFASPEQCEEKELDIRSDIYSLGATLWFLLAGDALFRGSFYSIMRAHVTAPPPFETLAKAPAPLVNLLGRLLAKNPADRPSTPLEAAREIESTLEILSADPAQHRPLAIAAKGTAALPMASSAAEAAGSPQAAPPRARNAASAAARSIRDWRSLYLAGGAAVLVAVAWVPFAFQLRSDTDISRANTAAENSAGKPATGVPLERGRAAAPPTPPSHSGASGLTNRLGMQFVTVEGLAPRVSVWETRLRDFRAFAAAGGNVPNGAASPWEDPGFHQEPDHPVVNVSWEEAVQFCAWLTEHDRAGGFISPSQFYRLPDRIEWDTLAGNPPPDARDRGFDPAPNGGGRPAERMPPPPRGGLNGGPRGPAFGTPPPPRRGAGPGGPGRKQPPFVWGGHLFPPPEGSGNFADLSAANANAAITAIPGYNDSFAHTSPAGSFRPTRDGIFDTAGNVWEMCQERGAAGQIGMQGGGWTTAAQEEFVMHLSLPIQPGQRLNSLGFRVVLDETAR